MQCWLLPPSGAPCCCPALQVLTCKCSPASAHLQVLTCKPLQFIMPVPSIIPTTPAGRGLRHAPSSSCGLPGGSVTEYMQCGGLSNTPAGVAQEQANATWACCPPGTSCQALSDFYWQCLPPASGGPSCVQVSSSRQAGRH
jgi:hypothetical protein